MKIIVPIVVFLLLLEAMAQEKPKPSIQPVTDSEKIAILQAQKELLGAQSTLQATAEYQRFVAAQAALQKAGQDVYTSRKITNAEYLLCDGPSAGPCSDVKKDEFALRPQPKPEPKK